MNSQPKTDDTNLTAFGQRLRQFLGGEEFEEDLERYLNKHAKTGRQVGTYTYTNAHICIYVYMYICIYVYMYIYIHIYTCLYAYKHSYTHPLIHRKIHTCIHTYTHTLIHSYTHT